MSKRAQNEGAEGLGAALLCGGIVVVVVVVVWAGIALTYQQQIAASRQAEAQQAQGEAPAATLSPEQAAPTPTEAACGAPAGWQPYEVQAGDNLPTLAWRSGTTSYTLMRGNCLESTAIFVGQRLYLPPTTPTPSP
ncbi:MAG: LysM peptidoglycan-binding domain-containing protein [Chloroflexi bacterium]|nr:LysM peptidoglycan-binding domain-containing protein [Chloroflexota bacterium]